MTKPLGDVVKRGQLYTAILQECVPAGYDPLIPLAQAALECSHFRKVIGLNNYWGIKVPKRTKWTGKVLRRWTSEQFEKLHDAQEYAKRHDDATVTFKDGIYIVRLPDDFCDWERERLALGYWMGLIERVYPQCLPYKQMPEDFYYGLISGKSKYATDLIYNIKCMKVYRNYEALEL